ncbi:hypothetical protein [Chitinophaga sp. MM2321]|uniref:hypothetical protein n=1 Tax=Chitinophaga sp. MM2321 TaxID=3137178 RepID=UPI0032D59524
MKLKSPIYGIRFFAILIISVSCQNGTKKPGEGTKSIIAVKDTFVQVSSEGTETAASFPVAVEILLPSQYRKGNGFPKGVKEKEWYELYKDEKSEKWIIAVADLNVTYGRDECVGDDVMIIKSKHDNAVFFFTPFAGLSTGLRTILEDKALFPEHTVAFNFNGKAYKLSPMGSCYDNEGHILPANEVKGQSEDELSENRIQNYMLNFVTPAGLNYQIASIDEMQSVTPKVIWVGDLNDDGLPDMVLDLRDFYESRHLFFFLSDKNDKEKPLKKIAELKVVNDC